MDDLFDTLRPPVQTVAEGITLLTGFADQSVLMPEIERIAARSRFRHMRTPGGRMSVAMTNCGQFGWISDSKGYRYDETDPDTGENWPTMPLCFSDLAQRAARRCGLDDFSPDACLINRYAPGASLGAHQDKDELDFSHPIVSVSLGLPATFLIYGSKRSGKPLPVQLREGDVLVMQDAARRAFHGVRKLADGQSPIGPYRINLTLRRAR